jgi:hypothetical protein
MDKRIEEITNYVVNVDRDIKIFFRDSKDAQIFLGLVDLVVAAYEIHAGDKRQVDHAFYNNRVFEKDYGRDSTDYVTVMPMSLPPSTVEIATERRSQLMVALPMIDDLTITESKLWFECHCPSER